MRTESKMVFKEYRERHKKEIRFTTPNEFGKEEVDHLNISIRSKSSLGRILDPAYQSTFEYPGIGKFKSVLCMVYWLKSKNRDDRIRTMNNDQLRKLVKTENLYNTQLPNYKAILMMATWIKLTKRPDLIKQIKRLSNDIVFLSYYNDKVSNLRITTNYAETMIKIADELRNAFKEDRVPFFESFLDDKKILDPHFVIDLL